MEATIDALFIGLAIHCNSIKYTDLPTLPFGCIHISQICRLAGLENVHIEQNQSGSRMLGSTNDEYKDVSLRDLCRSHDRDYPVNKAFL